ncbi:MAG: type I methionyl aminopeptidase [Puniceicoccales bacterium]|jgi:methionyl aminopeptidase|nr:type I methionyl aminopeptidase [Puniceicoccales bacterium]
MICRNNRERQGMREAGRVAAKLLRSVGERIRPGISTAELNEVTRELMGQAGAISAAYHYGSKKNPYPGYACFSLNDVIVHGIPSRDIILREGDILSIDLAVFYKNFCGDNTRTFRVGQVSPSADHLIQVAEEALMAGIQQALAGHYVNDISAAIEAVALRGGYSIVREFVGHGIGHEMHEGPQIPNYTLSQKGVKLRPGMSLAIEPMFTLGSADIQNDPDGWTVRTRDHSLAVHVEHTILVTENRPEILTLP